MRFSAAIQPQPPQRSVAAADFIRQLVAPAAHPKPAPAPSQRELPLDLDQRVRLVGEW